jgi:ribulose-bisphosphate carboxylase small chain
VLAEINACRATFPRHYVRVLAYDARLGRQTTAMQFLVQRPAEEPGFLLTRTEGKDRRQNYGVHSYATMSQAGDRYGAEQ